ncbi:MAG: RagB/SusD family nutrient uptake outer membrane protein [Candidatus Cryptobacteroides sp.]
MKLNRYFTLALSALAFSACVDFEEAKPQGGTMLASQLQTTNIVAPTRAEASFNGLFTDLGKPNVFYGSDRADDWGFLMINFSNDAESADLVIADSGYNWFIVCGEWSSRNANYANPYMRYGNPYNLISKVNTFVSSFPEDTDDEKTLNMIAQARALRAYAYYNLVTDYQFNYQIAKNEPAVPIVTEETTNFTENPRATVAEVYELMLSDLGYAVQILDASTIARATKMFINADVAHGLRARVYLTMGEWDKAYADAQAAAKNYTPASIEEVSHPSFMDISEHNWLWGYDMTTDMAKYGLVQTTSSWLRSFSAEAYAPSCAVYACINNILYDKIAATDVRKGWWVDPDLKSPLLEGLTWDGAGDVANLTIPDIKEPFIPYTNVKFGCYTCGTTKNDEDTPLMRVEEMILIMAEAKAHSNEAEARKILEDFVKQYRDPSYNSNERGLKLLDEIWFQRRVELWGEGFGMKDVRRLQKPVVRFHSGQESNVPDAFRFNVAADDGWMLLRFPQREMNTNFAIVDNTGGNQPVAGQNPELKDGVTD